MSATAIRHPKPLGDLENTQTARADLNDNLIGSYFYVSAPYLDLGGNGIIVTLSRPIRLEGFSDFVLCFDLPLQDEKLESILAEMTSQFSGDEVLARLQVNSNGNPKLMEASPPEVKWNDGQIDLVKKAKERIQGDSDISDFFGNIQELDQHEHGSATSPTPIQNTPQVDQPLALSIPLGDLKIEASARTAKFAFLRLDFAKHRKQIGTLGLVACTLFGLLTVLLAIVWGFAVKDAKESNDLIEELRVAFDRVSKVMAAAPLPYALVDANDYVSSCNVAFANLLKLDRDVLQGQTFRQLINDKDRYVYDSVEKRRRDHEAVSPYKLRMNTGEGGEVTVWVVSAAVPSVGQIKPGMPQTFGIMLENPPSLAEVINITPKPSGISQTG